MTTKTEKTFPQPGGRLKNGALVIAYRNYTVLAFWGNEYVVWRCDYGDPLFVVIGHYFRDFDAAVDNFQERSK